MTQALIRQGCCLLLLAAGSMRAQTPAQPEPPADRQPAAAVGPRAPDLGGDAARRPPADEGQVVSPRDGQVENLPQGQVENLPQGQVEAVSPNAAPNEGSPASRPDPFSASTSGLFNPIPSS